MPRRQTFRVLMGGAIVAGASLGAVVLDLACSRGGTAATAAPGGLTQLEADTGIKWKLITSDRGARTYPLGTPPVALRPGSDPGTAAVAFFAKYGGIWGIVDANEELLLDGSSTLAGRKYASFLQSEGGVAVDDTRFSISFDDAGHIKGVSGNFFPKLHGFPTKPALTPEQAAAAAEADMEKTLPAGATLDPRYTPKPHLLILPGTYPALPAPRLSYFLMLLYAFDAGPEAHGEAERIYYVDARSGAILASAPARKDQYTGTKVGSARGSGRGELPTTPTRSFNVLAKLDAGTVHAPYYMQQDLEGKPELYVVLPAQGTRVLSSSRLDLWDTQAVLNALPGQNAGSRVDPGSAVDAYFYVGETDQWWRKTGRNGWDNHDTVLSVRVHDPIDYTTSPPTVCANNSNWSPALDQITVCPRSLLSSEHFVGAMSVDLGVMGHEFQHGVSQAAFHGLGAFGAAGESLALAESLADVFGELVVHDYETSSANCIHGNVVVPGTGIRNLVDPHESPPPNGPQPEFYRGRYYNPSTSDAHLNDGVANKAWSLMTFGGTIEEGGGRRVPSNLAIGWDTSEALYIELTWMQKLRPTSTFHDLAESLDEAAAEKFGDTSQVRVANACAWYAVGVATKEDLTSWLDIDPCTCGDKPEAGTCDAGKDADVDAGAVLTCAYGETADAGPFMCSRFYGVSLGAAQTACDLVPYDGGPPIGQPVGACPTDPGYIGCCNKAYFTGRVQDCLYPGGIDPSTCVGTWVPNPAYKGDAGADAADAGDAADGGPHHC